MQAARLRNLQFIPKLRPEIWFNSYVISAASLSSSPSALFWLTVLLAVVTIIGAVISIIAWRSGILRKRLLLSITSRSRLLAAPEPMREDLKVTYQDGQLEDPYVITAEIANVGRSYISSEAFDKERSLEFALNVPIVKVLTTEHEPESAPPPMITASGKMFELKPELIAKGESITVSLLTEGRVSDVEISFNPFGDVDVDIRDREAWLKQRSRRKVIFAAASAVALTAALLLVSVLATVRINRNLSLSNQAAVDTACYNLLQNLQGLSVGIGAARVNMTVSRTKDGRVRAIVFSDGYDKALKLASPAAGAVVAAYRLVEAVGIPLGNTANMPGQATQVMAILRNLPKERSTAALSSDLAFIDKTTKRISYGSPVPHGCP